MDDLFAAARLNILPIRSPFLGARSYVAGSIESTQSLAKELAGLWDSAGGAQALPFPVGSLLAAEEQSAGRGRFPGRRWEAAAGKNLLFTLRLAPGAAALPALPLRIGGALCEAAETYARRRGLIYERPPRLKWPNDLMFGDRKAAGILCEAGAAGVFAGIGLNCNQDGFPPRLELKATSLARELGQEVERWALLELFLASLAASLYDQAWRQRAEALLWRRGEEAEFLQGGAGGPAAGAAAPGAVGMRGRIEGLDETGCLLFKAEGNSLARAFASGELSYGGAHQGPHS
jgi:BirA family transcriptional regulator, biotin operon repressor / biotin---[acetyl-CoA-carboxylase] ligase